MSSATRERMISWDVMGLHPVLGRLIGPADDGPKAPGVVVLTYRFWTTAFHKDPSVIGKTARLGSIGDRSATVIGILEPCVPYPQDTEIIANVVTSPHHLSATMVTGRIHRMTELFGRLAPGVTLDVPAMSYGKTPQQVVDFYKEAIRRIDALPGVTKTAFGDTVPWRDGGGPGLQFSADGHVDTGGGSDRVGAACGTRRAR
jgi:MacB-like periplasmic core domain